MTARENRGVHDPEIIAIGTVFDALRNLEPEAQERVIEYVARKLGIRPCGTETQGSPQSPERVVDAEGRAAESGGETPVDGEDSLEGISPVARKWITRSGLKCDQLCLLFSLGMEEIDLIAETVPGASKRERMRSVFLLKSAAAYLSSGTARVTHAQIKEACLHYDAFDSPNFAKHLKGMASEVGGSKEAGYTLTARGLTAATAMIKELLNKEPEGTD
jgi:hypothetical protein